MGPIEQLYLFLLMAFLGFCTLFLAGYLRYRGKHEMLLYLLGATVIGVAFINISSVKAYEINIFVIFIWVVIHLFISWLIVEGSTRFFNLRNKKMREREEEIIKKDPDKWFPQI